MTIVPKNWKDFQHYKDRNPPWIRLHKKLLDDYDFHCLHVASRALAPLLWLIASENIDGEIDCDYRKLGFRLHMEPSELEAALKPLLDSGFFLCKDDASNPLADCKQDAVPSHCISLHFNTEADGGFVSLANQNQNPNPEPKPPEQPPPQIDESQYDPNFDKRIEPLWQRLQAGLSKAKPNHAPPRLTKERRFSLWRCLQEHSPDEIANAACWLFTSGDRRAKFVDESAYPLDTLLKPEHVTKYVEAAEVWLKNRDRPSDVVAKFEASRKHRESLVGASNADGQTGKAIGTNGRP